MALEKEKLPLGYKPGKSRLYYSSRPSPGLIEKSKYSRVDHFFIFLLLALGVIVRLYKIPWPPRVVFDEVHFGGFAREYFNGEYFVDVHPPLAKLMYYWIAIAFGWDGNFEFAEIGDVFDDNVPYVQMRLFSGICGVLSILTTYGALKASGCRSMISFFGSFLVLIENSLVTQSRFILLDSSLVFAASLTVFAFKSFQISEPFTKRWFKFLILTGFGLGISTSIKLTGLYVVAWVGLLTIYQLWQLLGDLEVSITQLVFHFVSRVFGLIILPLTLYLGFFAIHFMTLPLNGSGSGAMSPRFKSTLADSDEIINSPVEVSYGSTVTLKQNNLEAYLHSHDHKYESGSGEQQVSLYGFNPDPNNQWIIETKNKNWEGQLQKKFRPVKDGDTIRLYHVATGKYLHVNDVRPPISEHEYSNEVSCNGTRDLAGDINYEWKVRIAMKKDHSTNDLPLIKVRTTETVFQLVHRGTKCILIGHEEKLPSWGFGQNEVLCVEEPTIPNSLWYVETNHHPLLESENYPTVQFGKVGFFSKVIEVHKAMFRINKSFTEDHSYASAPETWPFLLRGVNYYSNSLTEVKLIDESGSHIYFLGNLAIYYIGIFLIATVAFKFVFYVIRYMNPFKRPDDPLYKTVYYNGSFDFILGWLLNYFPSFNMSRQLFLHHYLVAVYFSILLIAQYGEYQLNVRKNIGTLMVIAIASAAIYSFVTFTPVIYGTEWTVDQCIKAKWFPSWDFDCVAYGK